MVILGLVLYGVLMVCVGYGLSEIKHSWSRPKQEPTFQALNRRVR